MLLKHFSFKGEIGIYNIISTYLYGLILLNNHLLGITCNLKLKLNTVTKTMKYTTRTDLCK